MSHCARFCRTASLGTQWLKAPKANDGSDPRQLLVACAMPDNRCRQDGQGGENEAAFGDAALGAAAPGDGRDCRTRAGVNWCTLLRGVKGPGVRFGAYIRI
ncbi:hypothetical protein GCM10009828_079370 [Actinoplanes couchii]|uniref:Uncharacterized protein n=1 Tax=Actinoplanes couchii TaxID=403638 RepID=A0ABQ3XFN9_9ACTN|nr:hypothetical protein Aco03nite_057180 [Actinoplanes couchii]